MKILIIPFLTLIASIGSCQTQDNMAIANTSQKPVVVELFTSEGCSSCPSADKLLAEMSDKNPNILLLSFHVDYWNRLGWVDSFSKAQYTERQYAYSSKMHLSGVYTPQAVVNGQNEAVGSNRTNMTNFTKANYKYEAIINSANATINNKSVTVDIKTGDLPKNYELLVLLVQPHAATKVKGGENGGSYLPHKNVVRDMVILQQNTNTARLTAPFASNDWKVVVLAQNKNNGHIEDVSLADITNR